MIEVEASLQGSLENFDVIIHLAGVESVTSVEQEAKEVDC